MKQVLLLVILTFVVYANSLNGRLVFDDIQLVTHNPQLINIHSFGDVLALAGGPRQLLVFTYGLNFYLGGLNTFGYHLFNVVLHAINCILVYYIILALLRRTPDNAYIALAGSAVFSVHTLLTGAVSYIAGRSSVLCGTFYFSAVLLFIKALDAHTLKRRAVYLSLTLAATFLAWQTKQEAITLPLIMAGIVILRSDKVNWRWIVPLASAPLFLVILIREQMASLYAAVMDNRVLVAAGFEPVLQPTAYFRTYINAVVGYYLPRMAFPTRLSVDPQILEVQHWYSPELLFSVLVLGGLAWLTLRYRKEWPLMSYGVAALFVSPLSAYAVIPLADVVQEHRAYIPALGVALMFAAVFQWIARKHAQYRWAAVIAVVVVFSVMTIQRNTVWANSISLWSDAKQKSPGKPRPHFNLGQAYQEAQRMKEAIEEYQHALAIKADIHAAYSNIAAIYLDSGQLDKGEQTLLKVTEIAPEFTEGFINLAVLYLRRQQSDKALAAIDRAIELNAESFAAHFNRGEILTQKGDHKEAVKSYQRAVYLRPDLPQFRVSLAVALINADDYSAAEQELQGLTSGPFAAEAYRNLGILHNRRGEAEEAIKFFEQAIRTRPVFPEARHDLAVIYLRRQQPQKALEELRMVLSQKDDFAPAVLNIALAYQLTGDVAQARKALSNYLDKYGRSNSPFVPQVQQRLASLSR
ncbi:MAG: tetratricopeptide repeat protein [Acidobacteria bacterium]|nr:tetratricopeptide repeat protein [Acidobacteriota bacterium]